MAEAAAAILGIIGSSATCLEACIKGLAILSKARCYHRDVSGISLMFELEMHKLYAWGVEVGLTQQTQALLVDAQSIETVFKVLKHLESLVTDLDKLRRAHGLELQETTEQVLQLEDNASALGRLRIEVAEGLDRALNRMFKGRKEPWKVLKWVSFDQPRAKGLIDEIGAFVHQLQQILDQDRQRKLVKGMDMLLRNAVLNSANEQDLDMIGHTRRGALTGNDVAAAARFKKQGLLLGVVNTRAESVERFGASASSLSPEPILRSRSSQCLLPRYSNQDLARTKLSASRLTLPSVYRDREKRVMARYDENPSSLSSKTRPTKTEMRLRTGWGRCRSF